MQKLRANGLASEIGALRLGCLLLKAGSRDDDCLANYLWNAQRFLEEAEERIEEILEEEEWERPSDDAKKSEIATVMP